MSRGRDDDWTDRRESDAAGARTGDTAPTRRPRDVEHPDHARVERRADVPTDHLLLPLGPEREAVTANGNTYTVRGSETRILATVGAFRVVREDDLAGSRSGAESLQADLRRLADDGLIERRTIPINHESTRIVVLTRAGQTLLNDHREPAADDREQAYHAGLVKRRELAHDAQIYRLYQSEAAAIEARGGRITRVVIDAELKRDYQCFLNRPDRATQARGDRNERDEPDNNVQTFARANDLPVIDGHLQLPDLRIEFEREGQIERRDLELVTEHYSRAQLASKARAGFALFRASGGRRGGTPHDPHHLRRLA